MTFAVVREVRGRIKHLCGRESLTVIRQRYRRYQPDMRVTSGSNRLRSRKRAIIALGLINQPMVV
jgi:transposase InsO family protein